MFLRIDRYIFFNILFYLAALIYGITKHYLIFSNAHLVYFLLVTGTVHGIKILRMYVIAGEHISFTEHLKQYCKCVPVSMILPFKVGDLFKIFCYGKKIGNSLKSAIIVLLDRFADICALMSVNLFMRIIWPYPFMTIEYLLILFLSLLILCYKTFPELFRYWNHFLMRTKAKKRNLLLLEWLYILDEVYTEISNVCKMRFMILYVLSLATWGIEMVSLVLFCKMFSIENISKEVSDYLSASLIGGDNIFLQYFVLAGVVLLLLIYAISKGKELWCTNGTRF